MISLERSPYQKKALALSDVLGAIQHRRRLGFIEGYAGASLWLWRWDGIVDTRSISIYHEAFLDSGSLLNLRVLIKESHLKRLILSASSSRMPSKTPTPITPRYAFNIR